MVYAARGVVHKTIEVTQSTASEILPLSDMGTLHGLWVMPLLTKHEYEALKEKLSEAKSRYTASTIRIEHLKDLIESLKRENQELENAFKSVDSPLVLKLFSSKAR